MTTILDFGRGVIGQCQGHHAGQGQQHNQAVCHGSWGATTKAIIIIDCPVNAAVPVSNVDFAYEDFPPAWTPILRPCTGHALLFQDATAVEEF